MNFTGPDEQLLNHATLNDLREAVGNSFAILIDAFTLEIDQRITSIKAAESVSTIKHEAHAIKGTAAAYGAESLSALAGSIEETCDSGSMINDVLVENVTALDLTWQQTKRALAQL